jgi:hypothetical protein
VQKISAVYISEPGQKEMAMLEPDFYSIVPECGAAMDTPFALILSPALRVMRCEKSLRAIYEAGYAANAVPADLVAACLELASWNLTRYKGRRIGLTGNIRGNGRDGECTI